MLGWRGRLGLIVPMNNTVIEPEFWQAVPEGVTIHGHRIGYRPEERKGDYMEVMRSDAVKNAFKLAPVDCVAYCCLTTSFYKGLKWDLDLLQGIERNLGKPVTTAATAMVNALNALKIKNVAIATPFKVEVNERLVIFLKDNGFNVDGIKALDPTPSLEEVGRLPVTAAYQLAKEALQPSSDGVFICATDLPSMSIVEALEKDIGKPAVSTNQAILWDMLRILNIRTPLLGFGSLLENPSNPEVN